MFDGLRKKLTDVVKIFGREETGKAQQQTDAKADEPRQQGPAAEAKAAAHAAAVTNEKGEQKAVARREPSAQERPAYERAGADGDGAGTSAGIEEPRGNAGLVEKRRQPADETIRLSLLTKVKGAVLGSVRLSDGEIERFLDMLKVSMLGSDVSFDTTEAFLDGVRAELHDKPINSRQVESAIAEVVRKSLLDVLRPSKEPVAMGEFVASRVRSGAKPVKVLFLGPNGTGKTTTIAKLAHRFKAGGMSVVLSASDTFRAAAIEQMEHHAQRLGVPVIKSGYGADPASVAFDAVAYAKARGADLVLIDSAGRQETNKNLIAEVQKMVRVVKPDLTIFVGESTAGNAIAEQINEFCKHIQIDGIVLTKLDCDAKGGGAISITHRTGLPVLFFGTGEGYDALVDYSPGFIVDAIVPGNN